VSKVGEPRRTKKRYYTKSFYTFLIFYLIIAAYVGANVFDLQFWPLSYFNPPEKPTNLYFNLDYPIQSGFIWMSNGQMVHVEVNLSAPTRIAEDLPVTMTAVGSVSSSYSQNITHVFVGFTGATVYSAQENVYPIGSQFESIDLTQQYEPMPFIGLAIGPKIGGAPQTIVWKVQGDYAPTIVILFKNFTAITQTYPYLAVHVASVDVARSERYNRVNTALSIALVGFGFVEGAKILIELAEKRNQSKESTAKPNMATTPPKRTSDTK
jgi:hypothetical protein